MTMEASSNAIAVVRPVVATLLVIAIAWAICGSVSPLLLTTSVGVAFQACVPPQIVIGPVLHGGWPSSVANSSQPAKGLGLTLLMIAAGAVCFAWIEYGFGKGLGPPPPMTVMYTIFSIVVCLWLALVWRCWPLTLFLKSPPALGAGALVVSYGVAFVLFKLLFNFDFMAGAPVYVAALDPKGMFNAWTVLVYGVTSAATIMAFVLLDFWPVSRLVGENRPALISALSTPLILAVAAVWMWLFVAKLGMDPVVFTARFPVPFIFGFFLITAMAENRLLMGMAQPLKGLLLIVTAAVAMAILYVLYAAAAPLLARAPLPSGAPGYDLELWVATAMLGITFPVLIAHAAFFNFWPLRR